jgi:hypothetical protein
MAEKSLWWCDVNPPVTLDLLLMWVFVASLYGDRSLFGVGADGLLFMDTSLPPAF